MAKGLKIRGSRLFFDSLSLTNKLIIANILFYIVSLLVLSILGEEFFLENIALNPSLIIQGQSLWTIITSMFSHIMFFHIFANMFSLFFIGNFLEKIIGSKRFLSVYLISGLMGSLFFIAGSIIFGDFTPGIGASGAIFGVLGMLAVMVPYSRIYLIIGPLILILADVLLRPFIPLDFLSAFSLLINIMIFVMIFSMLSFNPRLRKLAVPVELPMWALPIIAIVPLVAIGFFVELPIGNSAHIGGLVVGLLYGFYLRRKFPRKTERISRYFSR